jgi:hypothetical protein
MVREASPAEFGLWAALYQLNPWGEMRADLRVAIGHALFAEANRDRNKRPAPYGARDFMPYAQPTDEERERELQDRLRGAFAGMEGGRKGENLKAWRREQRRRVGKARQ